MLLSAARVLVSVLFDVWVLWWCLEGLIGRFVFFLVDMVCAFLVCFGCGVMFALRYDFNGTLDIDVVLDVYELVTFLLTCL